MSSQSSDDEKLGHDPLEWLSSDEEEGQELVDTNDAQVSSQEGENGIDASDDVEPQSEEQAVDDKCEETTASLSPEADDASQAKMFDFPESVTVQHIESLHDKMLAYVDSLDAGDVCQLDFKSVNQVDSSGYQLLLSTKKTCDAKQLAFSVNNIQARLKNQLSLFGDKHILSSEGA